MKDAQALVLSVGDRVRYVGWHPGLFGAEGRVAEVGWHIPVVRCEFPNAGPCAGSWYVSVSLLKSFGLAPGPDYNGFESGAE